MKCGKNLEEENQDSPAEPQYSAGGEGIRCENCGIMNEMGASVCKICNKPLGKKPSEKKSQNPLETACPKCGFNMNPQFAKFCMKCGAQLAPAGKPAPVSPISEAKFVIMPSMKEISLPQREKRIGREDFLDHIPPEKAKFISREHLKIMYGNNRYYITDEGSTNGTKLNGVDIRKKGKMELNTGDEIILADIVTVQFQM